MKLRCFKEAVQKAESMKYEPLREIWIDALDVSILKPVGADCTEIITKGGNKVVVIGKLADVKSEVSV